MPIGSGDHVQVGHRRSIELDTHPVLGERKCLLVERGGIDTVQFDVTVAVADDRVAFLVVLPNSESSA